MMPFALITGGSKGIGKSIATELAARRYNLLLVARDASLLSAHASYVSEKYGIEAHYLALDLSQTGATQVLMDWIISNNYNVGVLVNNAGYGLSGPFTKYSANDHLEMMRVNMEVPVALTASLLKSTIISTRSPTSTIARWLIAVPWFERSNLRRTYDLVPPASCLITIRSAATSSTTPAVSLITAAPESIAATRSMPVPTSGATLRSSGTA